MSHSQGGTYGAFASSRYPEPAVAELLSSRYVESQLHVDAQAMLTKDRFKVNKELQSLLT